MSIVPRYSVSIVDNLDNSSVESVTRVKEIVGDTLKDNVEFVEVTH